MSWTVETLNETVDAEVEALPEDMRARLARIAKLIEENGGVAMARISEMHKKWMKEPKYRKAYEALEEKFVLASAVVDVRNRAGLTQAALAQKMGTTQPVVARLESGRTRPSMRTLERLADATGSRLRISFEPRDAKRPAR